MTPDRKHLLTFEELRDVNAHKDIRVQALKFWQRDLVQEDLSNFQVTWLVHSPCQDVEAGIKIQALSNKQMLIVNGAKVQGWGLNRENRWQILG
jgi:hypothetical protein